MGMVSINVIVWWVCVVLHVAHVGLGRLLASSSTGQYALVAVGDTVYSSQNFGTAWTRMASPLITWTSLSMDDSGGNFVASSAGSVFHARYPYTSFEKVLETTPSKSSWLSSSAAVTTDGSYVGAVFVVDNLDPATATEYPFVIQMRTVSLLSGVPFQDRDTLATNRGRGLSTRIALSTNVKYGAFNSYDVLYDVNGQNIFVDIDGYYGNDLAISNDGKIVVMPTGSNYLLQNSMFTTSIGLWERFQLPDGAGASVTVDVSATTEYIAAGTQNPERIYISTNYGASWRLVFSGADGYTIQTVSISDDGQTVHILFFSTTQPGAIGIMTSNNNGNTWGVIHGPLGYTCGAGDYLVALNSTCRPCGYTFGQSVHDIPGSQVTCGNEMRRYYNDGHSLTCNASCSHYPVNIANSQYTDCDRQYSYPAYPLTAPTCDAATGEAHLGLRGYYLDASSQEDFVVLVICLVMAISAVATSRMFAGMFLSTEHKSALRQPRVVMHCLTVALLVLDSCARLMYLMHSKIFSRALFVGMLFVVMFRSLVCVCVQLIRCQATVYLYWVHVPVYFFTTDAYDNGVKFIISVVVISIVFCLNMPWLAPLFGFGYAMSFLHVGACLPLQYLWLRWWTNDPIRWENNPDRRHGESGVLLWDSAWFSFVTASTVVLEVFPWSILLIVNQLTMRNEVDNHLVWATWAGFSLVLSLMTMLAGAGDVWSQGMEIVSLIRGTQTLNENKSSVWYALWQMRKRQQQQSDRQLIRQMEDDEGVLLDGPLLASGSLTNEDTGALTYHTVQEYELAIRELESDILRMEQQTHRRQRKRK